MPEDLLPDQIAAEQNEGGASEPAAQAEAASNESISNDAAVHDAEPAAEEAAEAAPMHWYIIHAYSGFENKVAESLKTRAEAFGFADKIGQILIPIEEVVELRNGKKVTSKRLLYPGYVMVQMEMNDELWHAVKATPRVTGFVGGGDKMGASTNTNFGRCFWITWANSILVKLASDRPTL